MPAATTGEGDVHADEYTCRADEMRDEWFSVSTVLTGEQANGEVVTSFHQFNLVNAVPCAPASD